MATQKALAAADITQLGYVALQNYLKNKPIDQVATERPLLKALMAKKKSWGGGKENIVEQIRTDYGNNFGWNYVVIENVIIENNHSHNGGGMAFFRVNGPVLNNVTVRNNTATAFGGGLSLIHI